MGTARSSHSISASRPRIRISHPFLILDVSFSLRRSGIRSTPSASLQRQRQNFEACRCGLSDPPISNLNNVLALFCVPAKAVHGAAGAVQCVRRWARGNARLLSSHASAMRPGIRMDSRVNRATMILVRPSLHSRTNFRTYSLQVE